MAIINLTKDTFDSIIHDNDIVLLDFWAPWCGPCHQFAPVFESASEEHSDIVFAKVNTEEERELAGRFGIRSIPTLMVFREQIIVFSQPGALPPAALKTVIEKVGELDMEDVRRQVAEMEQQKEKET
jgi:thioredoxin 1